MQTGGHNNQSDRPAYTTATKSDRPADTSTASQTDWQTQHQPARQIKDTTASQTLDRQTQEQPFRQTSRHNNSHWVRQTVTQFCKYSLANTTRFIFLQHLETFQSKLWQTAQNCRNSPALPVVSIGQWHPLIKARDTSNLWINLTRELPLDPRLVSAQWSLLIAPMIAYYIYVYCASIVHPVYTDVASVYSAWR